MLHILTEKLVKYKSHYTQGHKRSQYAPQHAENSAFVFFCKVALYQFLKKELVLLGFINYLFYHNGHFIPFLYPNLYILKIILNLYCQYLPFQKLQAFHLLLHYKYLHPWIQQIFLPPYILVCLVLSHLAANLHFCRFYQSRFQ